ncbi:nucleotidyltransferase and HEPN domain-containing protein [Methylobacterium sp. J-067]|uniref:nucleotidyltransferase and HEPN domain-containing protein n=1 Tax=Methylobacterium sp. J-067 TaxID=2836648 RepID=UPI001FB8F8A5|nr:nucleotidyltransferase and HEPN domain-containing protein [Methylobacterium sp. J-067]MCJ2027674.1 nucleotidyltransferase and HEPN domain-containing protein [Methylobacterium sp. J-067]
MILEDRLAHLPVRKRRDLMRAMTILFEEFEEFQKGKTSQKKKRGRIVRVVLYGSHARGGWVEDRASGYFSDYDVLVVVNHENLVDEVDLWDPVRDRIIQTEMLKPWPHATTNIIVHSHADVNDQMSRGRPFFTDIVRDGITLYESEGFPLAEPGPLTPEARNEEAWLHYETWFSSADRSFITGQEQAAKGLQDLGWRKSAAFSLHQATESYYHCALLVLTLYSPQLHALRRLRPMAEGVDRRLVEAWPRNTRLARRRFNLLHDAYVKARYSRHYTISLEELEWLAERVGVLQRIVREVCAEPLGPRPDAFLAPYTPSG